MTDDARGLPITASNAESVGAFDHTIDGYLALAVDTGERLKAVFAADPTMPMAHVLKGYFFLLMATPGLKAKAQGIIEDMGDSLGAVTERERHHAMAMNAWAHGKTDEALSRWETILVNHPGDILALRLAHHGYFYKGDSQNLRDVVSRTMHAWDESVPGYGFVMGMRSFGLEETHAYDVAIEAGEHAVALIPENPWAIHVVAHVYEMIDQPADGIAWLTDNEPGWTGAHNFRYHIWWHRALMRLDRGEYDEVLALYDETIWDPDSDEYLDLCNDAALLMRLELHGVDVGDRWQALADKCRGRKNDHILAFIDVHFALALAAAGAPEADELLESQRAYAVADAEDNSLIAREIGLPLSEAMVAYRSGDFVRAVDLMMPIRYHLPHMGGSHAQRDLFAMMLLDASIRAGHAGLSRSLAAERLCRMPQNQWAHATYERAFAG